MPDPTTERILTTLPDTVGRTIDALAWRLATPAERLTDALVAYVWARGLTGVVVGVFVLLVPATLVVWANVMVWRWTALMDDDDDRGTIRAVACAVGGLVVAIALIAGADTIFDSLPLLIAPVGAGLVAILTGKGLP